MNKERRRVLIQIALFITTFVTTTFAGAEWAYSKSILMKDYTWSDFVSGMEFSVPFLLILTVHEFGHYFTAIYHKVKTSLPYYIPIPPGIFLSIGTIGAIIRIRSKVSSNIQHFDIGLAGPLSGFIVAVVIMFYGFTTLPPADYVYTFHPEYEKFGPGYADHVYSEEYRKSLPEEQQLGALDIIFGKSIIFWFFENYVADPSRVPNPHEMMHYPILMAAFIALFFTSLNLLPIGQLDGGHIIYGLFGRKGHRLIATVFFVLFLFYSGLGIVNVHDVQQRDSLVWIIPLLVVFYYICLSGLRLSWQDTMMYAIIIFAVQFLVVWVFPTVNGYTGWLLFGLVVGRFLGVHHPPSEVEMPLDSGRKILGWIALIIFVICFSPAPLEIK